MGNHDVGRHFAGGADMFWAVIPEAKATKELTLKSLEALGERYRGADAEFDDHLFDHTTPLGRMVAIAFDVTPDELKPDDDDGEYWYEGPVTRFRRHFDFC